MEEFLKLSDNKLMNLWNCWTHPVKQAFRATVMTPQCDWLMMVNTNIFHVHISSHISAEKICVWTQNRRCPLGTNSNAAHHLSFKAGRFPNDPAGDQLWLTLYRIYSSILTNQRGRPLTPHQSKATGFKTRLFLCDSMCVWVCVFSLLLIVVIYLSSSRVCTHIIVFLSLWGLWWT